MKKKAQQIIYNQLGYGIIKTVTTKFNSNGDEVEKVTKTPPNKTKKITYKYKYDSENNVVEMTECKPYGSITKHTHKYNSDGKKSECVQTNSNDKIIKIVRWNFDDYRYSFQRVEYDSVDNIISNKYYTIDSNGNVIQMLQCDSEGILTRRIVNDYDKKDKIIKSEFYLYDENTEFYKEKVEYEYNSNGLLSTKNVYHLGQTLDLTIDFEYKYE